MLEVAQLRSGFEPELVDEERADTRAGGQRVCLTTRPVKPGDHQRPEPLLVGVGLDRGFEVGEHARVARALAGREHGLQQRDSGRAQPNPMGDRPIASGRQRLVAEPIASPARGARRSPFEITRSRGSAARQPHRRAPNACRSIAGSTSSRYPSLVPTTSALSPSAFRSCDTFDCSVFLCVDTAVSPHRSSTRRSVRTSAPASTARRTKSSEVFPDGTATSTPSRVTATESSTEIASTCEAYDSGDADLLGATEPARRWPATARRSSRSATGTTARSRRSS